VTSRPSPLQKLSLRTNFSWTFVGNVVYAGCQWGLLMLLVKLTTPEAVGQFTLGIAITAPIVLFSNLQLRSIQSTDVQQTYPFIDYFVLRVLTSILALLTILVLVMGVGYDSDTALMIGLVGLAKSIESISDVFYGLFQQQERMDWIAISMILKGIFSLLAVGIVIGITQSALWGTAALGIAWTIGLLGYDLPQGKKITASAVPPVRQSGWFHGQTLGQIALFALPLGFAMALISLNANIPRYFIERYLGQGKLGIFSAIAYLQIAGTTLVLALGQSASPRLAQHYVEGQLRQFNRLIGNLLWIVSVLGILGILAAFFAGEQILTLLYRPEYGKDISVFGWVMVSSFLSYAASIFGFAATAKRRITYQPIVLFTALIVSCLTCYFWIPTLGLVGASLSMVATAAVTLLGYILIVIKK
jgi:O-antigen/teichoic acid export membrane protein